MQRAALASALTAVVCAIGPARADTLEACELPRADRARATTADCTRCHDGSIPGPKAPSGNGSHSVDVDYAARQARKPDTYRPRSALPPQLVLNEGKVTCTTCHDGASTIPFRLALPMKQSELCNACHDPK